MIHFRCWLVYNVDDFVDVAVVVVAVEGVSVVAAAVDDVAVAAVIAVEVRCNCWMERSQVHTPSRVDLVWMSEL
jgi:hypothetical protein